MTEKEFLKSLSERIKTIRKEKGLTQSELAERLGTNHTYVVRMEKGNQDSRISSLFVLAKALGVELRELVSL